MYSKTKVQRWSPRGRPWPREQILKSLASKVKSFASSPRKLACPRLENSTIFWIVKILWSAWKMFGKRFLVEIAWKIFVKAFFFLEIARKTFCEDLFFFLESTCACVLGLEHSCPWPRECLSSERLSLASDYFCVLGLEPWVLDSTSGKVILRIYLQSKTQTFSPLIRPLHVVVKL